MAIVKATERFGACELPEKMRIRILRLEPRPGKENRIEDFMKMMNERGHEAQSIINEDKMVCEVGFIVVEEGKRLLYWLQILGDTPITVDASIPILRDTYAYLDEIFIREETEELAPQFAIFGEPILKQILDYIRTEK